LCTIGVHAQLEPPQTKADKDAKVKYESFADRNFARACSAQTRYTRVEPTYPLSRDPSPWNDGWIKSPATGEYVPYKWFRRAVRRAANRWLGTHAGPQMRALAGRVAVKATDKGEVSVHLYAGSRSAQRRPQHAAVALGRRLERTLCASCAGPLLGLWVVVVSWGWDPAGLGEDDRLRAEIRAVMQPGA